MEASLSNQIFDIKEKLTDAEYKNLMETLATVRTQRMEEEDNYYKVVIAVPRVDRDDGMKNDPCFLQTSIQMIERVIQFTEEKYAKVGLTYTHLMKDCKNFREPVYGHFKAVNIDEDTEEETESVTFSSMMSAESVYIASCKKL